MAFFPLFFCFWFGGWVPEFDPQTVQSTFGRFGDSPAWIDVLEGPRAPISLIMGSNPKKTDPNRFKPIVVLAVTTCFNTWHCRCFFFSDFRREAYLFTPEGCTQIFMCLEEVHTSIPKSQVLPTEVLGLEVRRHHAWRGQSYALECSSETATLWQTGFFGKPIFAALLESVRSFKENSPMFFCFKGNPLLIVLFQRDSTHFRGATAPRRSRAKHGDSSPESRVPLFQEAEDELKHFREYNLACFEKLRDHSAENPKEAGSR